MQVKVCDRLGNVLTYSRNLAAILRYNRKSPVTTIRVGRIDDPEFTGQTLVVFYFADGAHCATHWASVYVFIIWLMERRSIVADRLNLQNVTMSQGFNNPCIARIRRKGTIVHGNVINPA